MRQKGSFINMCVPAAGLKMVRPFLIPRGTVGNISQKMSKQGHSLGWACP